MCWSCKCRHVYAYQSKKIDRNNSIKPFTKLSNFKNITSNRDSAGKAYFMDLSLQILKPKCFEKMNGNQKPFLWLGNKILPFEKEFGGDIDADWQFILLENWLKKTFKKNKAFHQIFLDKYKN